ncbi:MULTISPECIES: hypothetical protein [unclassified Bradyrhizobium]|uniref:hypothetical protein n=1 Tax=unclassified Bradyrhizobium TaxID=2631580 RepID=UPI002916B9DD|nr:MULTISPECIES: hypothetical protein [unclassified Bradyrhizobium]
MNPSQPKPDPDRQPLTVGHGKKLYDQSRAISAQVKELVPLLTLLEHATPDTEQDPIAQITRFLEILADHSQRHTELLQGIDEKLNFLLANSSISEP